MDVLTRHSVFSVSSGFFMFIGMVVLVYWYVWNFHNWYIGGEIGSLRFSLTYACFMLGILQYLNGSTMVMVLG